MKTFKGLESFSDFLFDRAIATPLAMTEGVAAAAENYRIHLKNEVIGSPSELIPLAPATQDWRIRYGFTPNNPLLLTGSLRDSIGIETGFMRASVGTNDIKMVYHEFGYIGKSGPVPPRPAFQITQKRTNKETVTIAGLSIGKMLGLEVMRF